ncbi:MAG: hypothetical protein RL092_2039 [Bacteroidota bacterium]|jgi:hypothetical protein
MKTMKKISLICIIACLAVFNLFAQPQSGQQPGLKMLDGAYIPVNNLERSYRIPRYPNLRESDVLWKKRVWEDINGNEKMNYPIFLPLNRTEKRYSFYHVIEEGLNNQFITAWEAVRPDPAGVNPMQTDEFSAALGGNTSNCKGKNPALAVYSPGVRAGVSPFDPNDMANFPQMYPAADEMLDDSDEDGWPNPGWMCQKIGVTGLVPCSGIEANWDPLGLGKPNIDAAPQFPGILDFGCPNIFFEAKDIVGYRLKEDWIFDKQRSTRFVRIIGVAPLVKCDKTNTSPYIYPAFQNEEVRPLFWLHYASCRSWFAQWDVYNMSNDAFRGSFDDLFEMRRFSAHVVKEENVFDRKIQDYAQGLDALLEGERIKKEIFEYEHDLWNY